jgi:hypothetical protein
MPIITPVTIPPGQTIKFAEVEWDQTNDLGTKLLRDEYIIDGFIRPYYIGSDLYPEIHDYELTSITLEKPKNRVDTTFLFNLLSKLWSSLF